MAVNHNSTRIAASSIYGHIKILDILNSDDKTVRLWDVASGEEIRRY